MSIKLITRALVAALWLSSGAIVNAGETLQSMAKASEVAQYLQDISVTVQVESEEGEGEGSGVIVTRNVGGEMLSFVWTAAHVIEDLRTTRKVNDPKSGSEKTVVEFGDVNILREIFHKGRRVGELRMSAKVLKFSDADNGHDLALLQVRKAGFNQASARFYLDKDIPAIGVRVFHVGSLLGASGANSMTSGIISQIGRLIPGVKFEFDQCSATAFPGSSGGGVYLEDGSYVGMLVRTSGEQFNFIVPIRSMVDWAKSNNILWAIDPTVEVPTLAEIEAMPIEDVGATFQDTPSKNGIKKSRSRMLYWRKPSASASVYTPAPNK